jgi:hypothetical protein
VSGFAKMVHTDEPVIERLDWVDSAGAIQNQIWTRIASADLVFVDITGQNPNVMFEAGVCAAQKDVDQVIFLKDELHKLEPPFDIAPFRYIGYTLTSEGLPRFDSRLSSVVRDVLIRFPDRQGSAPDVELPLSIDFSGGRDSQILYTPPYAHRRVVNGWLEFGSSWSFPHSWASVGKRPFDFFDIQFNARALDTFAEPGGCYIGVGVHSQHFYANFGHVFYLNSAGFVIITEPDEQPPNFYTDNVLRQRHPIDLTTTHQFRIRWDQAALMVQVDEFQRTFEVPAMKKTFGPGLIRLQSFRTRMAVDRLRVDPV